MKRFIYVLFFLISTSAFSNIRMGEYDLGNCKVRVGKGYTSDQVEVRVEGKGYGSLLIDMRNLEIVSINSCNSLASSKRHPVETIISYEGEKVIVDAKCGGRFHSMDAKVLAIFDEESGLLSSFNLLFKIAKIGFPNGINSGPIKEIIEDFSCF